MNPLPVGDEPMPNEVLVIIDADDVAVVIDTGGVRKCAGRKRQEPERAVGSPNESHRVGAVLQIYRTRRRERSVDA